METYNLDLVGLFMSDEEAFNQFMRGNYVQNIDGNQVKEDLEFINSFLDDDTILNINIDSVGGDYKHGWIVRYAIQDVLKTRKVTMTAIGDVGSTASMVFMSVPKENRFAKHGSTGFIHNPSMVVLGEAKEHEKVAKVLRDTEDEMANFYAEDMGISVEQAKKYMDDAVLFSTKMMIESGFAGSLIDNKEEQKEDYLISAVWQKSCIDGKCNIEENKFKNFINQL